MEEVAGLRARDKRGKKTGLSAVLLEDLHGHYWLAIKSCPVAPRAGHGPVDSFIRLPDGEVDTFARDLERHLEKRREG